MPFLAISCFLMYANLIAAVRYIQRGNGAIGPALLSAGHMVACMVSSVGFLFGMELIVFDRSGGIAGDAYNWTPVFYLAFGVISLLLFGVKLYGKVRQRPEIKRCHGLRDDAVGCGGQHVYLRYDYRSSQLLPRSRTYRPDGRVLFW